jgi:hypothetical protein
MFITQINSETYFKNIGLAVALESLNEKEYRKSDEHLGQNAY